MRLCLLSYDAPHLKTAQVALGLHNRGMRHIDFLLMPFKKRPERPVLFKHRPSQFRGPSPRALAGMNGGAIFPYEHWPALIDRYDLFLVCGSNLVEPAFANTGKILNVHAGLIPAVRGLDSFKWAVLKELPLGNTLHKIDEHVDAGEVIYQLSTPVFAEDDLKTLARRHYENEIWMLTNFDRLIAEPSVLSFEEQASTMRMPADVEKEMLRNFNQFKAKFSVRESAAH